MATGRWCAIVIIGAGLLMIVLQVAAQLAIDVGWVRKPAGSPSSSFIGLAVLFIGTVLMALISLSEKYRSSK